MGNLLPDSFWPLALAHAFALLSPGPDFMLIVSHGMRRGLAGSLFICAGIAAGNALYIALAVAGRTGLGTNPLVLRPLELAGAVYLAWIGWKIFRNARPLSDAEGAAPLRAPAQFAVGLASAVLNPKNMIFYLTIMTVLIENDATVRQRIAAGVWMCGVVLLWDLFVAAAIARPALRRMLWKWIPAVEKTCGAFLMLTAAWVVYGCLKNSI